MAASKQNPVSNVTNAMLAPFTRGVITARTRAMLAKRMSEHSGKMTTAVVGQMEARHEWFLKLSAEERSWITLVATSGIEGFIKWFSDESDIDPSALFNVAPRAMTRRITLNQTVDLIRTTIDVVEQQIHQLMPRNDRPALLSAIVYYSREVAFASARVYARAAESRGTWDERMEALVVDAVVRGDSDDALISRASALGWTGSRVAVVVGQVPAELDLASLRAGGQHLGMSVLAAVQGERLVVVIADDGQHLTDAEQAVKIVTELADHFGVGKVVVGPVVNSLVGASRSARIAFSGFRSAPAWPEGPRVVDAAALLPERVLAGNGPARHELINDVYQPLRDAASDLLQTCVTFLDHNQSIEASARALFVHANTVRYRLRRIQDVTGYSPTEPRGAYVLRLAVTLGRLHE